MNRSTPHPGPTTNANPGPEPIPYTLPSTVSPGGDSSFVVTPGKPVIASTLSPKELAYQFSRSRRTIYRWISDGIIPKRFVGRAGLREVCISIEAVEYLRGSFGGMHVPE